MPLDASINRTVITIEVWDDGSINVDAERVEFEDVPGVGPAEVRGGVPTDEQIDKAMSVIRASLKVP